MGQLCPACFLEFEPTGDNAQGLCPLCAGAAPDPRQARPAPLPPPLDTRKKRDASARSAEGLAYPQRLEFSRFAYDQGVGNLIGVPLALVLAWLFCSTSLGNMFASMVGMAFHELGHASIAWLSSRFAVPLPFFTFHLEEQSLLMGLLVGGLLCWSTYQSWREDNRFAIGISVALLLVFLVFSLGVSGHRSLMWGTLSGALGELVFGSFLLIAFFFPMPDRARWDFWRWFVLVPASLTYVHALKLWRTVSADVSLMPWGSALGSDSDGDMNRLVKTYGWGANELADFYLGAGYLCLAAIAVAYGFAVWRQLRGRDEADA